MIQVLGDDHLGTLLAMDNLADVYMYERMCLEALWRWIA